MRERTRPRLDALDTLDDEQLIAIELRLRERFFARERREPHLKDTTFRELRGSPELLAAWTEWMWVTRAVGDRGLDAVRR